MSENGKICTCTYMYYKHMGHFLNYSTCMYCNVLIHVLLQNIHSLFNAHPRPSLKPSQCLVVRDSVKVCSVQWGNCTRSS